MAQKSDLINQIQQWQGTLQKSVQPDYLTELAHAHIQEAGFNLAILEAMGKQYRELYDKFKAEDQAGVSSSRDKAMIMYGAMKALGKVREYIQAGGPQIYGK